jgi:hypothetical protein
MKLFGIRSLFAIIAKENFDEILDNLWKIISLIFWINYVLVFIILLCYASRFSK